MSTGLDGIILERIAFLREQVKPENKPNVNAAFQLQVDVLQSADLEKLEKSILMRKEHLKKTKDVNETDRLFCELDALEWLQRQVQKHSR